MPRFRKIASYGTRGILAPIRTSVLPARLDAIENAVVKVDSSAGLNAVGDALKSLNFSLPEAIRVGNAAVANSIDKLAAALVQYQAPSVTVPSPEAFTVIARVSQVRDALCDENKPNFKSANAKLASERGAQSTATVRALIARAAPGLVAEFDAQFADLKDPSRFAEECRERLAQLLLFETNVIATM